MKGAGCQREDYANLADISILLLLKKRLHVVAPQLRIFSVFTDSVLLFRSKVAF